MEVVKTRKNGLIFGFTIFISAYLILINLFFSEYMGSFDEKSSWVPQVLLITLLPYVLSTINQIMKDRCFIVINNAFAISIALYVAYFAFNLMVMAAKNSIDMDWNAVTMYLTLPSYGLISLITFMLMSRIAMRYKVGFHIIFGGLVVAAILAFILQVDTSTMNNVIKV